MSLVGFDWNVVVAGFWNPAILTPEGIKRRLFELEQGIPVQLEVPLDGLGPYKVKYEEITVTAEQGRLIVYAKNPTYTLLNRARSIAAKAISDLPETPVTAAGFNIRAKMESFPEDLIPTITPHLDTLIADADFSIETGLLRRALKHGDGVINMSIEQKDGLTVLLNFHRESKRGSDLVAWLNQPMNSVQSAVSRIFERVIGIPLGDLGNE